MNEGAIVFYTKHTFTMGHTSSQRSEMLTRLFRDLRSFKRKITASNIFD